MIVPFRRCIGRKNWPSDFLKKSLVFLEHQFADKNNKDTLQTLISCMHNKLDEGNNYTWYLLFPDVKKGPNFVN